MRKRAADLELIKENGGGPPDSCARQRFAKHQSPFYRTAVLK
jgi:hypothetical protein